jgi:hypothetical protein
MSLNHVGMQKCRESEGHIFYMEVNQTRQIVRVLVTDEVLTGEDKSARNKCDLRTKLDKARTEFEAIATKKYNNGQITADGLIVISLSDIGSVSNRTLDASYMSGIKKHANGNKTQYD